MNKSSLKCQTVVQRSMRTIMIFLLFAGSFMTSHFVIATTFHTFYLASCLLQFLSLLHSNMTLEIHAQCSNVQIIIKRLITRTIYKHFRPADKDYQMRTSIYILNKARSSWSRGNVQSS